MQEFNLTVPFSNMRLTVTLWKDHFRLSRQSGSVTLSTQLKSIHRHNDYEIFLISEAPLTVHTLDTTETYEQAVVIIPPKLDHFVSFEESIHGYYLYLSIDKASDEKGFFERLGNISPNRVTALPLGEDERFYADRIDRDLKRPEPTETLPHLFALLFDSLFAELISDGESGSNVETKYERYANTIDQYLSLHYSEPIRLSDLSRELFLCPKQTSRILQRTYGCSFSELVNRNRLSAACMLLRYTELDIGEIAAQVGYEYENYFYSVFRKAYGITPKQYRQMKQ